MNNRYRLIILLFAWLLVVISFITTQLTNDFFPFWAYGRFVSNSSETGIASLLETWEMKGILFRAYVYFEYVLTAHFSTLFNAYGQIVYKIIGIIPFLLILLVSVLILPKDYHLGYRKSEIFFIISVLLLSVHFASHFQAEMWGVLLLILSFCIYLHEGWATKVLAAVVYSLTFYLKSPIPLLGGSLVLGSLLLKKQSFKKALSDIIPFALTTVVTLSISLTLLYCYYPQEITDIWNASHYQHTLFHGFNGLFWSLSHFVWHFFLSFFYNPIVTLGLITTIVLVINWGKNHNWSRILWLLFIWGFPVLYILLSNHFFEYHYYLLSYSASLSIIVLYNSGYKLKPRRVFVASLLYITFFLFALSSVCPTNIYQRKQYALLQKELLDKTGYYVGCQLGKEPILYLDCGIGAFMFSNKSYLRYFYPLPLQRISSSDAFAKTEVYKEVKKMAMNYKGEYITLQEEWFFSNNNEDIREKINNEYLLEKDIIIPGYSWSFIVNKPYFGKLSIYKRKNMTE